MESEASAFKDLQMCCHSALAIEKPCWLQAPSTANALRQRRRASLYRCAAGEQQQGYCTHRALLARSAAARACCGHQQGDDIELPCSTATSNSVSFCLVASKGDTYRRLANSSTAASSVLAASSSALSLLLRSVT